MAAERVQEVYEVTTLVTPYQHDSDGGELIYALRAAERYINNPYWICVGDEPPGVNPDKYVPYQRCTDNRHKERNIFEKLLVAEVDGDFVTLYDDEILLATFNSMPVTIPWPDWGTYRYTVENTRRLFLYAVNYDRHYPMLMNAQRLEVLRGYDWPDYGYCIKSLYGNHYCLPHFVGDDVKVRIVPVQEPWQSWPGVSTSEFSFADIKKELNLLYTNKSRWEI